MNECGNFRTSTDRMFRDAMTDLKSGESLEAGGSVLRFSLYSCLVGWSVKHDHAFATPLSKVETKIAIAPAATPDLASDLALVAVQMMWMLRPSPQHIRIGTRPLLCHFWPSAQLWAPVGLKAGPKLRLSGEAGTGTPSHPGHATETHVIIVISR